MTWVSLRFTNVFDPSSNSYGMVVPGSQPEIHAHDTRILGRSFCNPKQWEKANGILSRFKRLRSFVSIQQKCWTATSFVSLWVKAARNSGTKWKIHKNSREVKWNSPWVQWVEVKISQICNKMLEKRISQIPVTQTQKINRTGKVFSANGFIKLGDQNCNKISASVLMQFYSHQTFGTFGIPHPTSTR